MNKPSDTACRLYVLAALLTVCMTMSAHGLRFLNPSDHIDRRTSFNVFAYAHPRFEHKLEIKFDIQIPRTEEIGYILRITDDESGKKYNIFYEGRGNNWFELNEEGKKTIARLTFDMEKLRNRKWVPFSLSMNLNHQTIRMSVGTKSVTIKNVSLPNNNFAPNIVFGLSDYLIDVPSFTMRNLVVEGCKTPYFFPLQQGEGNVVFDSKNNKTGYVHNPYWAINDQYHWQKLATMQSASGAGSCYDAKKHQLYFYNKNGLTIYDVDNNKTTAIRYANPCPIDINLGMGVIDNNGRRLYLYEVYKHSKTDDEASVASLDLTTMTWRTESTDQLETQRHHHGQAQYMTGGKFFIFGGFGHMQYSDNIAVYDTTAHKWQEYNMKGKIEPRYFTSLGCDSKGKSLYIFSGMGNESGSQSIGRQYFYDLYHIDLTTMKTQKMWQLNCGKEYSLVPVRSMVITDSSFATLCYPEFISKSHLRLMNFSLKDGSHEIWGDSIPIKSDKIATNANIYYDEQLCRYFVTVQEFSNDIASSLSLYSINGVPLTKSEYKTLTTTPPDVRTLMGGMALLIFICEAAGASVIWLRYRRRRIIRHNRKNKIPVAPVRPNSFYLFGNFMAFDRKGRDISYMFTNKLCELTILLLSRGPEGLSSKLLGTMLWADRDADKIKNLRSVTINHLRKVLQEMDGVQLIYSEGAFRLITELVFYIDANELFSIIESENDSTASTTIPSKATDNNKISGFDPKLCTATDFRLLQILKRGKYLRNIDSPNLDDCKSQMESVLLPVVLRRMEYTFSQNRFTQAIDYAEIAFHIDPYNIKAYKYKVRSLKKIDKTIEADDFARKFRNNYHKDYGEELKE